MKLLDPSVAMKTPQLCMLPFWMLSDPRVERFANKVGYTTGIGGFTPSKKCPPSLMRHFQKLWKERTAAAELKAKR